MVSLSGLGSGLDTQSIISALVAVEQQKIDSVSARGIAQSTQLSSWSTIRTALTALSGAASALATPSSWQALAATSSDTSVATVAAGAGTSTGSLSFTVDALASAGMIRSTNTIASLAARITTLPNILVGAGGGKLGLGTLAASSGVSVGTHTIAVTQASTGATKTAGTPLAATTVIDSSNQALQVQVNGTTYNLTIAAGTYDAKQLTDAINTAATNAGAGIKATTNGAGALQIASASEGSAATLRVTGGTSLTALKLTTDATALTGTNGQVSVDGGPAQTFGGAGAMITPGSSVTLNVPSGGTISATFSGGLRVGTITTNNVSTGDGSLQSVVAAINGANAGVSAAAVSVGANAYRLQLGSTSSGAGSDPTLSATQFDATVVGGFATLTQGTDAQLTIGSGVGAYQITSSTNTFTNILAGVSVTAQSVSTNPVTINVSNDSNGLADKVQKIVDAANAAVDAVKKATAYDSANNVASPLTGDSTASRLQRSLYNAIINVVPGANPDTPSLAGLASDKDGKYTFDRQKFLDAYAKDPAGTSKLFAQNGSTTNSAVTFVNASDSTQSGTYAINVTTAASRAHSSSGGAIAAGTTIRARVGTTIASYTVQAGNTSADIMSGLNQAFAAQGLSLVASTNSSGGVNIDSASYGSGATMDVAWNGSSYATSHGTDVAGTINGVAATGYGQLLTAPGTDPTLGGISVQVNGTATGALGSVTYSPGLAARLGQSITQATDSVSGYITSTEAGINSTKKLIDDQVSSMEDHLQTYQDGLKAQFTNLETTLANLKNQQSWLAGQLANL